LEEFYKNDIFDPERKFETLVHNVAFLMRIKEDKIDENCIILDY